MSLHSTAERPPGRLRISRWTAILPLSALILLVVLISPGHSEAATAPPLGTAQSFAVLAGAGITNTGPTTIGGNAGTHPTPDQTGFASVTFSSGANQFDNAVTEGAKADLLTAYNNAAGQTPVTTVATELGGTTKLAGIYDSASGTFGITGTLTLDAEEDPAAVFIFQMETTLINAVGSNINLINGAQACNVFWQVGSSATIAGSSSFVGNILAQTTVTLGAGATVDGRVLALDGEVTMDTNTITAANCAVASTSTPTATSTLEPGATNTATATQTSTSEPGPTNTATATQTSTSEPGPTNTATATQTSTSEPGPTNTATATPTSTSEPGPTNTATPTQTSTAQPGPTNTATATQTSTAQPQATNTLTPTQTSTVQAQATSTPTGTPTATMTRTSTATATLTATATSTAIAVSTGTVVAQLENTVTATPTTTALGSATATGVTSSTDGPGSDSAGAGATGTGSALGITAPSTGDGALLNREEASNGGSTTVVLLLMSLMVLGTFAVGGAAKIRSDSN